MVTCVGKGTDSGPSKPASTLKFPTPPHLNSQIQYNYCIEHIAVYSKDYNGSSTVLLWDVIQLREKVQEWCPTLKVLQATCTRDAVVQCGLIYSETHMHTLDRFELT